MPKSTRQISPGFAAGMFGFLFVHVLEHGVGGFVEELQFVPLVKFTQAAADCRSFCVRQLGQLIQDFCRAHAAR
jgi:hypothetical protein